MTSQIRSRVEYLMPTDNIVVFFHTQIWLQKLALLTDFQYALMIIQKWLSLYWATLYIQLFTFIHHNTIQYNTSTRLGLVMASGVLTGTSEPPQTPEQISEGSEIHDPHIDTPMIIVN